MSSFEQMVAEAKAQVEEVSVADLNQMIADSGDHFCLLDVREDWEWEEGHIFGALHIGRGILEMMAEKFLPNKELEIVVYCRGGQRSLLAALALKALGYTDVKSLAGGMTAWVAAGDEIDGELLDREAHLARLKEQRPEVGFDR